jgi:hypothetical protein
MTGAGEKKKAFYVLQKFYRELQDQSALKPTPKSAP